MAPPAPLVFSLPSVGDVSIALDKFVANCSSQAIKAHGRFTIAVSGGSLPNTLAAVLKNNREVDFSKWHVFFADERCVPLDHEDSNYLLAKKELLDHVPIPTGNVHPINNNLVKNPSEAAEDYESVLVKVFNDKNEVRFPTFDLILLGIGPDGHTCSLFPGHTLLEEKDLWVAPIEDSPKPPPQRITLTYPILNHANAIAFVVTGSNKQATLEKILDEKDNSLPATRVKLAHGQLYWFLDDAASATLKKTDIKKNF
ncbi:suppressor of los1-1 [Entomophthora muscae]|uniref:Suppressor of los1-1 n=1 Tax=Entomophthora muscae TaxID=34485 RepID=A0ACC2RHK4_9FUNG|nr:suppressor of los1-1 [Entomophthora muscae]